MVWYKKRTIIGNTYCLRKLDDFRNDLILYFNNIERSFGLEFIENSTGKQVRTKINRYVNEVHEIIITSGISTEVTYTPPPMIGGYRQNIDLVSNIFNFHMYQIEPNNLLDIVDRAIGRYESDRAQSIVRTLNPFFWFGRFLDILVSLPFRFFQRAGISTKAFEESFFGKIAKLILYLVSLAASFLTILQILGYLDPVKNFIESLILK